MLTYLDRIDFECIYFCGNFNSPNIISVSINRKANVWRPNGRKKLNRGSVAFSKIKNVSFFSRLMAVEDELRVSAIPEIKTRMFREQICQVCPFVCMAESVF